MIDENHEQVDMKLHESGEDTKITHIERVTQSNTAPLVSDQIRTVCNLIF